MSRRTAKSILGNTRKYVALFYVAVLIAVSGCAQSGGGEEDASDTGAQPTTVGNNTTMQQRTSDEPPTTPEIGSGSTNVAGGETLTNNGKTQAQGKASKPEKARTFTVRVKGAEGLPFDGNLGAGQELKRVRGTTPESYQLKADSGEPVIVASVRKRGTQEGALRVEVLRDGKLVASQETSGAAGMVNVVWSSKNSNDSG